MACTKLQKQSLPKWQKIDYQILRCQFVFEQFVFVFPEHVIRIHWNAEDMADLE